MVAPVAGQALFDPDDGVMLSEAPGSNDSNSDSDPAPTSPVSFDTDMLASGSLSPTDGSHSYLDFIQALAEAFRIPLDFLKVTKMVHQWLHANVPPSLILPLLLVHCQTLQEAWEWTAFVSLVPH